MLLGRALRSCAEKRGPLLPQPPIEEEEVIFNAKAT